MSDITGDAIKRAVCLEFGVTEDELMSPRRTGRIALARAIAMDLSRRIRKDRLKVVAWHFGKMDHTTIVAATHKVNGLFSTDPEIALRVTALEARLRAPELVEHF